MISKLATLQPIYSMSSYYTSSHVDQKFSDLIGTAPTLLNTLVEISSAINNDPNVYNTLNSAIGLKANQATTYTKTEVDNALALKQSTSAFNTAIADYYNKSAIDTKLNSYQTTTAFNTAIADYYTKSAIDTTLTSYLTTTAFNTSIANYFTKTEINNTLGSYVNTVSNTTNDNLSLISLTKTNNVLTLNYNNLVSKFGEYYSTAEVDFKLGQKMDNFTIGAGLTLLSLTGVTPELLFDPVILGNPSGALSPYDKLNFGFNQLKGSDNISLNLSNNIIQFSLINVYTSNEADSIFAPISSLGNYYTSSQVNGSLGNYTNTSNLNTMLSSYELKTELSSTFSNYYTKSNR